MSLKPYYSDDWATIYLGDCREILPQLPKVDLVLTDPPYGIGFAAQPTDYQRKRGQKREAWDNNVIENLPAIMNWGRWQVCWGGNYYTLPPSRGRLCWYKPDGPPSFARLELAWTNRDMNARHITHTISATNAERVGHPTQKPLKVISWSLSFFPEAQTILDPFMGSGTTLRAAKDMGRKSIGIEINERYAELAVKRLAQEALQFPHSQTNSTDNQPIEQSLL